MVRGVLAFAIVAVSISAAAQVRVVNEKGHAPQAMFACCDQGLDKMHALFSDPAVITDLKDLHAGLAVAISDLSEERAKTVRQLNEAGIPVIAWIVLPKEQGYYLNADNAPAAEQRFADFEKWTTEHGLRWVEVGLDIEPNFGEFAALRQHKLRLTWLLVRRYFDMRRVRESRAAYGELIRRIQAAGYPVQTYQMFFLADERKAHSTVLERLLGIVDVRGNDEVLMVYSSFNHPLDSALVWSYGVDAQTLAVGSTAGSGDPKIDAKIGPLDWDEFSRDLIVASHYWNEVGVYSLEGCVQQGFVAQLKSLNWSQPVTISAESIRKVRRFRQILQGILLTASQLQYFIVIAVAGVVWVIVRWRNRRRRRRNSDPARAAA